jgi:hypothetical protein
MSPACELAYLQARELLFPSPKPLTAGEGCQVNFPPCSVSYFGTVSATSRNTLTTRSLITQPIGSQ